MGMDVYGHKPAAPEGEYFRARIWEWPLLAELVTALCPDETSSCEYWYSNDGDGLNAAEAIALADALERKLRSGEVRSKLRLAIWSHGRSFLPSVRSNHTILSSWSRTSPSSMKPSWPGSPLSWPGSA
jgi:hypothetical protein